MDLKRKPILFDKIVRSRQDRGREVIGLIGTHHGVGVTHTGLMLAFYMGEYLGKKTAYLECNNHQDMILIQKAYEWSKEEKHSFSFHKISCFPNVRSDHITDILSENYECIIFDFGTDVTANREEFLRCNTKIVIGGRSEWDIMKLKHYSEATKEIQGSNNWLCFIPQANSKIITSIKNEVKRNVWAVPINLVPTMLSRETNQFFNRIF